jgi:hypothetical protein
MMQHAYRETSGISYLTSFQLDFQTYKVDELAGCLQQMKGASRWHSHGTSIAQSSINFGEMKSEALTSKSDSRD